MQLYNRLHGDNSTVSCYSVCMYNFIYIPDFAVSARVRVGRANAQDGRAHRKVLVDARLVGDTLEGRVVVVGVTNVDVEVNRGRLGRVAAVRRYDNHRVVGLCLGQTVALVYKPSTSLNVFLL